MFPKSSVGGVSGHYQARTHWHPPRYHLRGFRLVRLELSASLTSVTHPVLPAVTNKLLPKGHTVCSQGNPARRDLPVCARSPQTESQADTVRCILNQQRGLVRTFSRPLSHSTTESRNRCCLPGFWYAAVVYISWDLKRKKNRTILHRTGRRFLCSQLSNTYIMIKVLQEIVVAHFFSLNSCLRV